MEFKIMPLKEEVNLVLSVIEHSPSYEHFAHYMGLDRDLFFQVKESKEKDKLLWTIEKTRGMKIKEVDLKKIKEQWNGVEKEIYNIINKYTGKTPKQVTCYLAISINNGGSTKDSISAGAFSKNLFKLITHELFHVHYFDILHEIIDEDKIDKEKEWWLAEFVDDLILNQPEFSKFWKKKEWKGTQHEELRKGIYEKWEKKKDFKDFLRLIHGM